MLFLVIAKDGTDADAPARRQRVRERHLEGARALAESGALQVGGALLDGQGAMIGSALLVEAEDEAATRRLLEADVYHREGVWRSYEIYPFKRAV
ncbi:MAG: YciI family protein [Trueperaceae bacterium]